MFSSCDHLLTQRYNCEVLTTCTEDGIVFIYLLNMLNIELLEVSVMKQKNILFIGICRNAEFIRLTTHFSWLFIISVTFVLGEGSHAGLTLHLPHLPHTHF